MRPDCHCLGCSNSHFPPLWQPNAVTLLASKPSKPLRACPHAGAPALTTPPRFCCPPRAPYLTLIRSSHSTQVGGLQARIRDGGAAPPSPQATARRAQVRCTERMNLWQSCENSAATLAASSAARRLATEPASQPATAALAASTACAWRH